MDNSIGISQTIAWPGLYKNQRQLLAKQTQLASSTSKITQAEVIRQVRSAWYAYLLNKQTLNVLNFQDSIFKGFVSKAEIRVKTGETSALELISARNQFQQIQAQKLQVMTNLANNESALKQLLNTSAPLVIVQNQQPLILPVSLDSLDVTNNAHVSADLQNAEVAKARILVEKSKGLPDLTLGYSQQLIVSGFNPANINRSYSPGTRIAGIQVGIALPIFNRANRARVRSEQLSAQVAQTDLLNTKSRISMEYNQEVREYQQYLQAVNYYQNLGLKQADEQLRIAQASFDLGEIGYLEYIQNISAAVQTRLSYIEVLSQLNQSAIQIQFIKGE